jgi:hypothetical protein
MLQLVDILLELRRHVCDRTMLTDQINHRLGNGPHHEDLFRICQLVVEVNEAEEGKDHARVLQNELLVDERCANPRWLMIILLLFSLIGLGVPFLRGNHIQMEILLVGDLVAVLIKVEVRIDGLLDHVRIFIGDCATVIQDQAAETVNERRHGVVGVRGHGRNVADHAHLVCYWKVRGYFTKIRLSEFKFFRVWFS